MKIHELLAEAKVESRRRSEPRSVMASNLWPKTWEFEHTKFGGLEPELKNFLIDKCYYDPPPAHGKKDFLFSGANVKGLKGIGHAHLHFGKVVIIYEVQADRVLLLLAGDHKIVESGNLAVLGAQLKRLKDQPWTAWETPAIVQNTSLDDHIQQAAQEWLQMLASDPSLLSSLHKFAKDQRAVVYLVPYIAWEPKIKDLPAEQLQSLAIAFLKQS